MHPLIPTCLRKDPSPLPRIPTLTEEGQPTPQSPLGVPSPVCEHAFWQQLEVRDREVAGGASPR